jgi:hypothetical protein
MVPRHFINDNEQTAENRPLPLVASRSEWIWLFNASLEADISVGLQFCF